MLYTYSYFLERRDYMKIGKSLLLMGLGGCAVIAYQKYGCKALKKVDNMLDSKSKKVDNMLESMM